MLLGNRTELYLPANNINKMILVMTDCVLIIPYMYNIHILSINKKWCFAASAGCFGRSPRMVWSQRHAGQLDWRLFRVLFQPQIKGIACFFYTALVEADRIWLLFSPRILS